MKRPIIVLLGMLLVVSAVACGDSGSGEEELSQSCGDGTVDEGETCDDGNTDDGDGCSASCELEADSGETLWAHRFGDAEADGGAAIGLDAAGNAYVAGPFEGTIDLGGGTLSSAGDSDIFLAKFDPSGEHVWSKRFGDEEQTIERIIHQPLDIAVDDAGNIHLAGSMIGTVDFGGGPLTSAGGTDIFVAKFDTDGAHQWSKRFGAEAGESGESVAVDSEGNVVVSGHAIFDIEIADEVLASADGSALIVAKFDSDGNHMWSGRIAGDGAVPESKVAVDSAGNIALAGTMSDTLEFGDDVLTASETDENAVFLASLSPDGTPRWGRSFPGEALDYLRGIATDVDGNIAIIGNFGTSIDFGGEVLSANEEDSTDSGIFLAKFGADGAHLWSKGFGENGRHIGMGVAFDSLGDLYLTGSFDSSIDFGGETLTGSNRWMLVAKLGAAGEHVWSRTFASENDWSMGSGYALAVDPAGSAYVTGDFTDNADFGTGVLAAEEGKEDMWLVRLAP